MTVANELDARSSPGAKSRIGNSLPPRYPFGSTGGTARLGKVLKTVQVIGDNSSRQKQPCAGACNRDRAGVIQREILMIHRRALSRILAMSLAAPALMRSAFADEVSSIVIISQHGLPYLPLMVMETLKLVEKYTAKAGMTSLKPDYKTLGGTQSLIDALLSGQMNFGVTGVPSLATLWDKTAGTPNEVRALSAVQSMPFMLVTNRGSIKTISDFTDKDKIALPVVKVSAQAICLQMAAAKLWGNAQYNRLDPFTITRSHPDAAVSVMSKATEVNSHYSVAPY
jgi:NitT/TauT family transport system substrate-binding protein